MKLEASPLLMAMLSRPRQAVDHKHPPLRLKRLDRAADKWLARSGFFEPKSDEEKEMIAAEERYNLRGYFDPNR